MVKTVLTFVTSKVLRYRKVAHYMEIFSVVTTAKVLECFVLKQWLGVFVRIVMLIRNWANSKLSCQALVVTYNLN